MKKIAFFNKIAVSIQSIVNLGYPEIIAKIFIDRFGKNAHIIARWMNDYYTTGLRHNSPQDWLKNMSFLGGANMELILGQYFAAIAGEEEYNKWAKDWDYPPLSEAGYNFSTGESYPLDIETVIESSREELIEQFNKSIFFDRDLIRDVVSGELTNLAPYKRLNYNEARSKYEEKKILLYYPEIMKFDDEYRWINIGKKCDLIGSKMRNCGSTGVMGMDEDRTMLVLLDEFNNPHVVATLHPNENRISGFEGIASSAPKEKYHKYILDLINHLDVNFEENSGHSKSAILDLKYFLRNLNANIERINSDHSFYEYFKIDIDGATWFASPHYFISEEDALKIFEFLKNDKEFIRKKLLFRDEDDYDFSFEDIISDILPDRWDVREKYERILDVKFYGKRSRNILDILSGENNIDNKIAMLSKWLLKNGHTRDAEKIYSFSSRSIITS